MKKMIRCAALLLFIFSLSPASVPADTLPNGATPISGTASEFRVNGDDFEVTLPFSVPEGQVFVLTDIGVSMQLSTDKRLAIYAAEDLVRPRSVASIALGSSSGFHALYQNRFETGLVFESPPIVRLITCLSLCQRGDPVVSFSGYFKGAQL